MISCGIIAPPESPAHICEIAAQQHMRYLTRARPGEYMLLLATLHRALDAFLNADEAPTILLTREGMIRHLNDRYAGMPLRVVSDPNQQVIYLDDMHARIARMIQENAARRVVHQQKIDDNKGEQVDRDFINYYDTQGPRDALALTYLKALRTACESDPGYSADGPRPAPEAAMTAAEAVAQQCEFRAKTEQQLFTILETENYAFGMHYSNIMDRVYYATRSQHWLKADISDRKDELEANPTDQHVIHTLNQTYALYAAACALKSINLEKPGYSVTKWPENAFRDCWSQIHTAASVHAKRALVGNLIVHTDHEITALQSDLDAGRWPSHKAKQNARFDLFAKKWLANLLLVEDAKLQLA
jgi:hypothetical protein